jgi:hypothetical protein
VWICSVAIALSQLWVAVFLPLVVVYLRMSTNRQLSKHDILSRTTESILAATIQSEPLPVPTVEQHEFNPERAKDRRAQREAAKTTCLLEATGGESISDLSSAKGSKARKRRARRRKLKWHLARDEHASVIP